MRLNAIPRRSAVEAGLRSVVGTEHRGRGGSTPCDGGTTPVHRLAQAIHRAAHAAYANAGQQTQEHSGQNDCDARRRQGFDRRKRFRDDADIGGIDALLFAGLPRAQQIRLVDRPLCRRATLQLAQCDHFAAEVALAHLELGEAGGKLLLQLHGALQLGLGRGLDPPDLGIDQAARAAELRLDRLKLRMPWTEPRRKPIHLALQLRILRQQFLHGRRRKLFRQRAAQNRIGARATRGGGPRVEFERARPRGRELIVELENLFVRDQAPLGVDEIVLRLERFHLAFGRLDAGAQFVEPASQFARRPAGGIGLDLAIALQKHLGHGVGDQGGFFGAPRGDTDHDDEGLAAPFDGKGPAEIVYRE